MRRIKLVVVIGIFAAVLTAVESVNACSCMAPPTVLDAFESSAEVFVGEVTTIERTEDPNFGNGTGIRGANIKIQKVYKGDLKIGDTILFDQGGGADCRLTFSDGSIGWKLLVYSSPHEGRRYIITCGRSTGLAGAEDDLRYLDNLAWTKGKTRISGTLSFGFFGGVPEGQSLAGKKIRVTGEAGVFATITDEKGFYEIYDVPPGSYYIQPEIPQGWKLNDYMLEKTLEGSSSIISAGMMEYLNSDKKSTRFRIDVTKGRHVAFDFVFEISNAISGKLVGPDGKPLKGICVHAIPPTAADSLYGSVDCTEDDGRFEITELIHPEYILVINGDEEISGRSPLPKTFFPGVLDRSKATTIKMGPGQNPDVGIFKAPKALETVTLRGFLYYANGLPVATRKVQFVPDSSVPSKTSYVFYDYTDSDGSFEITILKGQRGKLRGEFFAGKKNLELCPDWNGAIVESKDSENWMITAATEWLEVKAERSIENIKFVFPFNACDKE